MAPARDTEMVYIRAISSSHDIDIYYDSRRPYCLALASGETMSNGRPALKGRGHHPGAKIMPRPVMSKDIVLYWSGGKDSAMAFHEIATHERYRDYKITSLLTTLTAGYDRITGHGVRRALLEMQAVSLGLDVVLTYIPKKATMAQYEDVMEDALRKYIESGTRVAASGDVFVEKMRMATFKTVGMKGCFPLMLKNTKDHVLNLVDLGFKAYVICVDANVLDESFVGRIVDRQFLDDLPFGVDPCGENGEYHTFVFDGPIFKKKVECQLGRIVFREGFYFRDVVPT